MAGSLNEAEVVKRLKTGAIITVRAKNGSCMPPFQWEPTAYRCAIKTQPIPAQIVLKLVNRRVIEPVQRGWYSEGQFRLNRNLRDARGRFRSQKKVSSHGR